MRINQLTTRFSLMVARRYVVGLESANASLIARVAALEDELERQKRQARVGRAIAGLLHDLNHPIQNIGNSATLLLGHDVDTETRESVRQTMTRELATLRRFMDDVRNVARPRPLDRRPMDVNASVAEAIDAVRTEAGRRMIALTSQLTPRLPIIEADRFALGRVCRNLLVNALQATPSGGTVVVATRLIGTMVAVEVSDTGEGIPPDRLATIFDDFVTTKPRGMGLGLATSQRAVEQLGGSIQVTSQLGRGTTFRVQLPAAAAREVQAAS